MTLLRHIGFMRNAFCFNGFNQAAIVLRYSAYIKPRKTIKTVKGRLFHTQFNFPWCNACKVNPRIEVNFWLANHEVNQRVEQLGIKQTTLRSHFSGRCQILLMV